MLETRKNLQQYHLKKAGIYRDRSAKPVTVPNKISDHAIENSFVKKVREAVEETLTDEFYRREIMYVQHRQKTIFKIFPD